MGSGGMGRVFLIAVDHLYLGLEMDLGCGTGR